MDKKEIIKAIRQQIKFHKSIAKQSKYSERAEGYIAGMEFIILVIKELK